MKPKVPILALTGVLVLVAILLAGSAVPAVQADDPLVISEVRIDQAGGDNDEYFELAGSAGASLDGLTYLVIGDGTGGSGVIEAVVDLSGMSIPASGYFVAAESTFTLAIADITTNLNFENSDNVTHLLVAGFSGSESDDLDTDDDGILDVTPWSELVDLIALVEEENPPTSTEFHYGPPSVGPDGSFVPGHAFLCDSGWIVGSFNFDNDTPGAANVCASPPPPTGACGETATLIHDVQGAGDASPLVGQTVIVEAVVVGDFQEGGELNGFFVQEEDADFDGDVNTSEGLFVYEGSYAAPDVNEGDLVRVVGTVVENFMHTEITANGVLLCEDAPGPYGPVDVTLPEDTDGDLEKVEGMNVNLTNTMSVAQNYFLGRYGQLTLSSDLANRLFQPTNQVLPNTPQSAALFDSNNRHLLFLDDGVDVSSCGDNPVPVPYLEQRLQPFYAAGIKSAT